MNLARGHGAMEEAMAFYISQIHPLFVGEVTGVDLRQPLDPGVVTEIDAAMDRHAMLVLRESGSIKSSSWSSRAPSVRSILACGRSRSSHVGFGTSNRSISRMPIRKVELPTETAARC
jgi:hypothetical protein